MFDAQKKLWKWQAYGIKHNINYEILQSVFIIFKYLFNTYLQKTPNS